MPRAKKQPATQRELDSLLEKWQKRLRLQDKDIRVKFASPEDLDTEVGERCFGKCFQDSISGNADILLLAPQFLTSDDTPYHDIELTLVHELVHVILNPIVKRTKEGSAGRSLEEQAVERLCRALLNK